MDRASYCEPKKIHEPEILHPNKYLASKFPNQKDTRLNTSILIYSIKQTLRPNKIRDRYGGCNFSTQKITSDPLSCIERVPPWTLSNVNSKREDKVWLKMNLYFSYKSCNNVDAFSVSITLKKLTPAEDVKTRSQILFSDNNYCGLCIRIATMNCCFREFSPHSCHVCQSDQGQFLVLLCAR